MPKKTEPLSAIEVKRLSQREVATNTFFNFRSEISNEQHD